MAGQHWGTHFIASSDTSHTLSGRVLLREELDEALLRRELDQLGLQGPIVRVTNQWYIRKVGQDTWLRVGESDDKASRFLVQWDSASVENGDYEVLEKMNVFVKAGPEQKVVARTNTRQVAVNN
ncbi:MAG: hypothetical protein M0R22_09965 [Dehalococcoidia bacterium]|jgi:hypothetical protein|nr:hypothetical protein [Dehalococcoidia bacterium]